MTDVETPPETPPEEIPPYQPDPPAAIDFPEPIYGDPDYELPPQTDTSPEMEAKREKMAESGIVGDPDAPEGYWVDENFRPNPLDVGSFTTTDHAFNDPNDLTQHSGLFANAGVHPDDIEQWPEEVDQSPPEEVPPGPDHPEPVGTQDVKESAEKTAEAAEKTVEKANQAHKATHATKAATKANPAGTKDTALESDA